MEYKLYGKTNKKISALGMGSTRFNADDLNDEEGIQRCSKLVVQASELGINYFDIASNYAKSQCETIYRRAFAEIDKPFYISAKSSSFQEKTSDDVMNKVYSSLKNLQVDKIDFFYMWSIMDWSHYLEIMKRGGPYEGALEAKKRGLIDHIVFSNHAPVLDAIKIINDDVFEGITLSYNILNYKLMDPLLVKAARKNIGVMVMNPLAGGVIPQNSELFSGICMNKDESVVEAALRFVHTNKSVTSVLSGVSNLAEVQMNVRAIDGLDKYDVKRKKYVEEKIQQIEGLCTGCGYCRTSCPQDIQIPEYMQSYNQTILNTGPKIYGRTEDKLKKRILVIKKIQMDYKIEFEDSKNKCIQCGKCEQICTQHLPIIERLDEMSDMIRISGIAVEQKRNRLKEIIKKRKYKKVGFYTAGGYTARVLSIYKELFGKIDFEVCIFDSNKNRWGEKLLNYTIMSPADIITSGVECLIISNFIYDKEIYNDLKKYKSENLEVIKLHDIGNVPWVF